MISVMKEYRVFYLPFPQSDVEAEMIVLAASPDQARKIFERIRPDVVFKEARET